MTDEELKKLHLEIKQLEESRAKAFEDSGEKLRQLEKLYNAEKNSRDFEEHKEEEMEAMCKYMDSVDTEAWCIKYKGGIWMSKHNKTTWASEGKARAALKNSLANFNGYYDIHNRWIRTKGTTEDYYNYLVENKLIEFCKIRDIKKGE